MNDFPKNKTEYLAALYLQKHDTSNLSPSEFYKKYQEIYKEMLNFKNSTQKITPKTRF